MGLERDIGAIKASFDDLIRMQVTEPSVSKEKDPYMVGLANGLLIGKAVIDGSEPKLLDPKKTREPYHSMDMHDGAGEDDGW